MAVNVIKRTWLQDRMVRPETLNGMAFQEEAGAHRFEITGYDSNGNEMAFSGTVTAIFLRPDNTDVPLTGVISNGVAQVTLSQECYQVPGRFGLAIFVNSGNTKTVVYKCIGPVGMTSSGVAASSVVQSVSTLIDRIDAAVNSIPQDYSALSKAVSATCPEMRDGSTGNPWNTDSITTKYIIKIDKSCDELILEYIGSTQAQFYVFGYSVFKGVADGTESYAARTSAASFLDYPEKYVQTEPYVIIPVSQLGDYTHIAFVLWAKSDDTTFIPLRIATEQNNLRVTFRHASYMGHEEINNRSVKVGVQNASRMASPLKLVHFSDLHRDVNALNRIRASAKFVCPNADNIICTGDMVANTYAEITSWWVPEIMTCIGNHDTASYDGTYDWTALTMAQRDEMYISPFKSYWGIVHTAGTSYYYKDYPAAHIRLIVMDAMLYSGTPGAEATAQTAWLADLLASAITDSLHVLIAIHAPHGGSVPVACSFTKLGQETMPVNADCNTPNVVINTVATAIGNGLHFIGYICGHTHQDAVWDCTGDRSQLMYTVTCAAVDQTAQWANSDQYRSEELDAFNVLTIDTASTTIKILRGGGANTDIALRPRVSMVINYSTGKIITDTYASGTQDAVVYGEAQELTDAQKAQARANIGAGSAADVSENAADITANANEITSLKSAFDSIAEFHGDNVFDKTHPQTKPLYINPATSKFANAGDQRLIYVSVDQGVDYSVKCGGESTKRIGFCASIPATLGDVNSISQVVGPMDLTINSGNNQYLAIQLFIDTDSDRTPSNYYDSIEIWDAASVWYSIKNDALDMDDTPTESSEKPVKSGGVYDAIAGKQSVLTFDDEPVSGSVNPVKSGGVYEAIIPVSETIKTELIVSRNLLNINDPDYKPDTKLSTTYGTPTNATGVFTTGFIPVEEEKTYNWIYGISISTSQIISRICAYGSDKSYKPTYTQDWARGFTIPAGSGIAYVRFSGNMLYMPPTEQNVMFTEGIPDRYYAYFTPYNKYTIKNSVLDMDYIQTLGGEKENLFPDWELGAYNNSWNLIDSTNTIRTDYIPVGDRLVITVPSGYQAKVYPFGLNGERNATYPFTVATETIVTSDVAKFVRITYSATTPETITDPNTYALDLEITRYGNQHAFNTIQSATPNAQDIKPEQVLPGYLALVAVKEKYEAGKMIETVGYLYRTVTAPYKLYYSQGKPDNIKYLCDWDTSIAGTYNNTPMYYCFAITDEGDIICVHRGEIESAARARDNPIVYPHTDYAHPVLVELTDEKPTSWISNCGCYAEPGHFWFGEYIRDVHAHANVWNVSAPYTNPSDWVVEKMYERDTNPSDPSSMVLGKIEHIHCVEKDPFTGILYVTTGDHHTEARIDYLKDGAWGILREADEEVCRQLNFIFTPTYVYWASDAFSIYDPDTQQMVGGAHKFFRAPRLANGLLDLENMDIIAIPALDGSISTYHTAYVKDPECILILDRHDDYSAYFEMPYRVWNIKEERMEFAGNMKQARGSVAQYLGFRCECCQHYPNLFDSVLSVGFSLYPNTLAVCGNPNPDIIPSMGGRTTDDSKNAEQVNTMTLKVIRT